LDQKSAELPGTIQQTFVTLKGMKVLSILRYEANRIQQWNEFCQSLRCVSKRTNRRKSITSNHSASQNISNPSARAVRKLLLKRLVWRNQQLYALLQTQHSWSCLCSYSDWKSGIMDAAPDIFT
jgi:hypothetical protein